MTKELYLLTVIKSHYCKSIFLLFSILFYFLLNIKSLTGLSYFLGLIFLFSFSLSLTCVVRNIKEKIKLQKLSQNKSSLLNLLASIIGITALQVCGLGAPVCGASLGLAFLSAILPNFILKFFLNYNLLILLIVIFLQFLSLYFLKCFTKVVRSCVEVKSCKD